MQGLGSVDAQAEAARLRAAEAVLEQAGEPIAPLERLTRAVTQLLGVPIAGVSVIENRTAVVLAATGLAPVSMGRQPGALCRACVRGGEMVEVLEPETDERFDRDPLVTGPSRLRYYVAVPVADLDGHVIGTLWAGDTRRRSLSADQLGLLRRLGQDLTDIFALLGKRTLDHQTGLFNRAYLVNLIELEARWCALENRSVTVCIVEIDGLGDLARTAPPAAEHALRAVAASLTDSVWRLADVVARIEDGRFAVLLSGTDQPGAEAVCIRLMDALDGLSMDHHDEPGRRAVIMVGSSTSDRPVDPEKILADAMGALEDARVAGGDIHVLRALADD